MPRALRIEYPGAFYHAMARGNNGQETFLTDDGRRLFLHTLDEACVQTGWRIHAYVLMSNHYHLLLETPEENLVAGMKWFQGAYTQRFNSMFKRRGHLYQGRYKAIPIGVSEGLEYFRMVSTYIHLNPFRAHIAGEGCEAPLESYLWSSYPFYTGFRRKRPEWLVREKVLKTWGLKEGVGGSLKTYREKMERSMKFELDPDAGRRGEFEKQVKRGWYIGSAEFRERLEKKLEGRTQNDNYRGAQRNDHGIHEAERLLDSALEVLQWNETELLNASPSRLEKQAIAWFLMMHTASTSVWIAQRLRMGHRTNCAHAISRFRQERNSKVENLKSRLGQILTG
jgi:REP element-mobilizing transposase RayT